MHHFLIDRHIFRSKVINIRNSAVKTVTSQEDERPEEGAQKDEHVMRIFADP